MKGVKMRTLIVVDMQNDFVTGALGTLEAQAIVPNIKKKITEYKECGDEIIFTRDTHYVGYEDCLEGKHLPVCHCLKGMDGWKVVDEIDIPDALHIDKEHFGYIGWPLWRSFCQSDIELVGVCTDICVISNALILKAELPETEIYVDASCCAGTTPEKHRAALEVMKSCQINVIGE